MEGYILSIVVPSYNISKYVDEVIPYYIDERFFGLLKILLIDDGATDDTREKIKPYVDKYPQLFFFYHKENGGHGSVINYAVEHVIDTKYFKVIDGDDWVFPDALFDLITYLKDADDDLVISDCSYEFHDHQSISYGIRKESGLYNLRIHNVTFKTSIFTKNSIHVREKVFYEDSQYVLYPLEFVRTIKYLPGVVARYRQDDPNQSVNPSVQLKRKDQYEIVLLDLLDFSRRIEMNCFIKEDLKIFIFNSVSRIMFGAFELNWSYFRPTNEAIKDCRRINKTYKEHHLIYTLMKKKYKRFRQMKFLHFNGIRIARLFHKGKK